MSMPARIFLSTAMGLTSAGLGAAASYAAGTAHIVPGCLVAFGLSAIVTFFWTAPRGTR